VVRLLGKGGMGAVYLGEHTVMGRARALKVITGDIVSNPQIADRFRREIQTAARLDHPNIVRAFDAEQSGQTCFLVMEYVEGIDLAELLKRKGPLPLVHCCHYICQAALGLQHAHENGMVHRDIKPQNLMLARKHVVKILDFGLAKVASEASTEAGCKTRAGAVMGTPDYMAPEQWMDARTADIRADIYSLGCTFFTLLTGNPPFHEAPGAWNKMAAHAKAAPPPLQDVRPEVPAELSALITRMLAKSPADRPQTPGEVAKTLLPFIRTAKQSQGSAGQSVGQPAGTGGPAVAARAAPDSSQRPSGSGPWEALAEASASQPLNPLKSKTQTPAKAGSPGRRAPWLVVGIAAALLAAAAGVAVGILFKPRVPEGTPVAEGNKPDAEAGKEIPEDRGQEAPKAVLDQPTAPAGPPPAPAIPPLRTPAPAQPNGPAVVPPAQLVPLAMTDRESAEWVLSHGGSIGFRRSEPKEDGRATKPADLPAGDFVVTEVELGGNARHIEDATVDQLRGCSAVTRVGFSKQPIGDVGLSKLAKYPGFERLTSITLSETSVTNNGLAALAAFRELERLELDSVAIDGVGLIHVRKLANLGYLSLKKTAVNNNHLFQLSGLTHLETLILDEQPITDQGLFNLNQISSLKKVSLQHSKASDAGAMRLAQFVKCEVVTDGGTFGPDGAISPPAAAGSSQSGPQHLDCTGSSGVTPDDVKNAQSAWAKHLQRDIAVHVKIAKDVKMTFVLIPPGKFRMGSPNTEPGHNNMNEFLHTELVTEPFDLGKIEVTQEQYEALLPGKNPSKFKGKSLPVEQVTWEEARNFAANLTKQLSDGYVYRLPTEKEWEYACRGGRGVSSYFGIGSGHALGFSEAAVERRGVAKKTTPFATYKPNAFGLYDMHGNVAEWCWDVFVFNPTLQPNPPLPQPGAFHVVKGGGWASTVSMCRSAARDSKKDDYLDSTIGFRLVRSLPKK
jgi:serine/threonine protein kinase/formylglycine-generating enzyme required for sulfatase activity